MVKRKLSGLTKEQAEDTLSETTIESLRRFCPIIKDTCRKDCICFEFGEVANYTSETMANYTYSWIVIPTACTHALIAQCIMVENA